MKAELITSIAENRSLRFFTIFILYIAQGIPIGLFFFAIPAWLASHNSSALEIGGYISAASLPWTLKFVNGFLMDRYTFLPMGRRRIWILSSQLVIIFGLVLLALLNILPSDVYILSVFSFLINGAATIQDVAVDGLAVEFLDDKERARGNGFMFGGQALGISGGASVAGYLITQYNFNVALFGTAFLVFLILFFVLFIRERPNEKILPWSTGEASNVNLQLQPKNWLDLIQNAWMAMAMRNCVVLGGALFMLGAMYGIYLGTLPIFTNELAGWTSSEYSTVSGIGKLLAGLLGVAIFGYVVDKIKFSRAVLIGCFFMILITVIMAASNFAWENSIVLTTFIITYLCIDVFLRITLFAKAMTFCSKKVSATQFGLFAAIANLGTSTSSFLLGRVESLSEYEAIFISISVAAVFGAILAILSDKIRPRTNN